jgi:hypothetical protein
MTERTLADLIDRVSPYKLDQALDCMAKVRYRYLEGLRGPGRSTYLVGAALDGVSNSVYREKIKDPETTASADDAADRFAAEFDYIAPTIDEWQEPRGDLLDKGVKATKVWRDSMAQFVLPFDVQPKLSLDITDPIDGSHYKLSGYPDILGVVRGTNAVVDVKAPGKRYGPNKLLTQTQPVAYTLMSGIPRFEYHVVTTTSRPAPQVIGATISDDHREFFIKRAGMIRRAIGHAYDSGDWIPNRGSNLCKRRYCDFWRECQRDYGGEVSA